MLSIEGVNIILGTKDRNKVVEYVEQAKSQEKINVVEDIMKTNEFEEMTIEKMQGKTRAYLKIQEGLQSILQLLHYSICSRADSKQKVGRHCSRDTPIGTTWI